MDPPDVLGVDLSGAWPTHLPGRAKKPCYDPVNDYEDLTSAAPKRLSLRKTGSVKGLKLKPAAWVSASKRGSGQTSGSGYSPNSEMSLIDFGEEFTRPSPVVEIQIPSLAKLALEAENILDRTPPQSPCRSLPRPLHPTPVVDWDARPLPPPPAYDDVAQDEDDMEVCSINSSELQHEEEQSEVHCPNEILSSGQKVEGEVVVSRGPDRANLEDNLFLPSRQSQGLSASFSQSAEIFQELQQECMRRLNVPTGIAVRSSSPEDKPQIPPRVPIPPRPIKRGDYTSARWSKDLSLSPTPADITEDISCKGQDRPPQIPPRDPLSQPNSRTPSPMGLVNFTSCSSTHTYGSYLSTSPGKLMPTTHSFASDPKYAAPKVIQAQGKDTSSKGPCILPIVRDGRKVSNTHYYLLPERPPYLDRYDRFFREAESLPASGVEEKQVRQANTATVRPMMVTLAEPGDLKANFSSNNNSSLGGTRSGMKTSVQETVHGVTMKECQAALQNHNWNVQKAVHYLKVEQLFCLGLRSRSECLKLLEMCDWNLELASTQMLDNYGPTTTQRYCIPIAFFSLGHKFPYGICISICLILVNAIYQEQFDLNSSNTAETFR
uniref:UBA domain-containing protein n=1 Tax=Mola mola TaxID=94237 RepID=A0A3Q3X5R6_MOLML